MYPTKKILLSIIAGALGLAGCASQPYATQQAGYPVAQSYPVPQSYPAPQTYPSPVYTPAQTYATLGTVDSIRMEQPAAASNGGTGGAIVGAVVGGLLGNQVGGGRGRTAATVAGAAGGAVIGAQMGQQSGQQASIYLLDVRLDNGSYRTLRQADITGLQPGSRVRIDNNIAYRY